MNTMISIMTKMMMPIAKPEISMDLSAVSHTGAPVPGLSSVGRSFVNLVGVGVGMAVLRVFDSTSIAVFLTRCK